MATEQAIDIIRKVSEDKFPELHLSDKGYSSGPEDILGLSHPTFLNVSKNMPEAMPVNAEFKRLRHLEPSNGNLGELRQLADLNTDRQRPRSEATAGSVNCRTCIIFNYPAFTFNPRRKKWPYWGGMLSQIMMPRSKIRASTGGSNPDCSMWENPEATATS